MKEIEILPNESGVPEVTLHGEAKAAAATKGISKIHLSLSHSDVSFFSFLAHWTTCAYRSMLDYCHCFRPSFYFMKDSRMIPVDRIISHVDPYSFHTLTFVRI